MCYRWLRWDATVALQGQPYPSLFHHLPQFHGLFHVPPTVARNAAHAYHSDCRVSVHTTRPHF